MQKLGFLHIGIVILCCQCLVLPHFAPNRQHFLRFVCYAGAMLSVRYPRSPWALSVGNLNSRAYNYIINQLINMFVKCSDTCRLSVDIFTRHVDKQKCMSMRPLLICTIFGNHDSHVGCHYSLKRFLCNIADNVV